MQESLSGADPDVLIVGLWPCCWFFLKGYEPGLDDEKVLSRAVNTLLAWVCADVLIVVRTASALAFQIICV